MTDELQSQAAIEERCKVRMYFDATMLITDEQVNECNKKSISQFPLPDPNTALCKLCSILTKEQMEKVIAYYYKIKWNHETLYDWYSQHCKVDTPIILPVLAI